jgi:multidrug efflux system membrane fusion protein
LVAQDEASLQADQAQIDSAKLSLIYCRITSPVTGKVGLRLVDPGNIVHASDTNGLVVITQMQPISVIFTLAEDQIALVRKRMRNSSLNVDLFDREMKNQLTHGTLSTLDNQIDPSTGTLRLRATFANADEALFPNQFVNVRLLVEEHTNVTLIPSAAVQRNAQGTTVYLISPQSTVSVRQVTLGANEGDMYEVTSGLAPGDAVVIAGTDRLQEGGKVNPQFNGESEPRVPRKTGKKP